MNENNNDINTTNELEIENNSSSEQNSNSENESGRGFRSLTFLLFLVLGALIIYSYKYPLLRTYDSWGSEHG